MLKHMPRRYWGLSVGEAAKYVPEARRGNFIAIGWNELPDLKAWAQREGQDQKRLWEEFRVFYKLRYPSDTLIQSGIQASQVWSFVIGMKPGDIVLVRESPKKKLHVAQVAGAYQFVAAPEDGCEYRHRREVEWIREDVDRDALPEGLKTSLRSLLTIFNLDKHRYAIEELIEELMGVVTGDDLVEVVLRRMAGLGPPQFEDFVGHLLGLAGFSASVTQRVSDKGVDIIGTLSAAGLAEITLNVQVKRIRSNVGIPEILQLRGTLGPDEHAAFVTLAGFTKQAIAEAQAPGKKGIMLIDGEMLVDMILEHYDELSEEYKELLKLQKKGAPLREQFATLR